MPYVNGPMILAHRIICDETGKKSYCQRADQLAATTLEVYRRFWMGPQFDFWYLRTMLEFAKDDNNGDWYGIVQRNARSALHRRGRQARALSPHLVRQEGLARQRPEGQPPAACRKRGALRLDGRARALSRGYGPVPAAASAAIASAIPKIAPIE